MARLIFDAEYGPDGSIGILLSADAPMRLPGTTWSGTLTSADGQTLVVEATSPERRGVFGAPEAEGWVTELVSADHTAGTARFVARPAP
jgi:hypothetical protein